MFLEIVNGRKCCTTRTHKRGQPGDSIITKRRQGTVTMELRLLIRMQVRTELGLVFRHLWRFEGFANRKEHEEYHFSIRKSYAARYGRVARPLDYSQLVWVEWFRDTPMPDSLLKKLECHGCRVLRMTKQVPLAVEFEPVPALPEVKHASGGGKAQATLELEA
jgi:hypothetical protein